MKVDARLIEIVLTIISCIFVGNALAVWLFKVSSIIPTEYYGLGTVLGTIWLAILVFEPRRLS